MNDYSRYKILLIDDDPTFVKWMTIAINKTFKSEVYHAENPIVGFKMIQEITPDLIMLDMEMPMMDGFTALKEIRTKEFSKNIPVIVCSSLISTNLFLSLVKLKITDYAIKTSGAQVILGKIEKALTGIDENLNN